MQIIGEPVPPADFKPYLVVKDTDREVVLRLSTLHAGLQLYLFRFMPVLVCVLMGVALSQAMATLPWWVFFLFGALVLFMIYFARKPILTRVTVAQNEVLIRFQYWFQARNVYVDIRNVDQIRLYIERAARGGQGRYELVLKDGHQQVFAVFPISFEVNKTKFYGINHRLEQITGLKVVHELEQPGL